MILNELKKINLSERKLFREQMYKLFVWYENIGREN
jgi:hypothetical protein